MYKSSFALPLTIVVLSAFNLLALGQEPRQPRPAVVPPGVPFAETRQEPEILSTNYRITFSGRSGEAAIGELSALTCSRNILIQAPLNSSDTPTTIKIEGTLEEKEGALILRYSLGYSYAVVSGTESPQPGQLQPPGGYRAVKYNDCVSRGTLKMKPGQTYELLKAGGSTYTIIVAPETDKAQAK